MTAAHARTGEDASPPTDGWRLFRGDGRARPVDFPEAPPWRRFTGGTEDAPRPRPYLIGPEEADVVNAALLLRRPLLVTGHPGTGKSSLAYAVAHELSLGRVLAWPVNSRSTLQDALYRYDAIGRLREANLRRERTESGAEPLPEGPGIGSYVRLGPLGTALVPGERPRVLLVDELDKGDVDLPNDLLTVFEEGEFEIPELARLPEQEGTIEVLTADPRRTVPVTRGRLRCSQFPVVVITSNGEREFPPAFLRGCVTSSGRTSAMPRWTGWRTCCVPSSTGGPAASWPPTSCSTPCSCARAGWTCRPTACSPPYSTASAGRCNRRAPRAGSPCRAGDPRRRAARPHRTRPHRTARRPRPGRGSPRASRW
jgi:hypothetical protein